MLPLVPAKARSGDRALVRGRPCPAHLGAEGCPARLGEVLIPGGVYKKQLQPLPTLPAVPGTRGEPSSTGQCLHAALGAPEGKPSPELLLEKKRLISSHLEESPSKSKCAHSFQRGRNNSFIHTSSIYQLRIAEDNLTMPTLAAPVPLLKGRTKVQLSLLQIERWFTVHSWSNQLKLFWG